MAVHSRQTEGGQFTTTMLPNPLRPTRGDRAAPTLRIIPLAPPRTAGDRPAVDIIPPKFTGPMGRRKGHPVVGTNPYTQTHHRLVPPIRDRSVLVATHLGPPRSRHMTSSVTVGDSVKNTTDRITEDLALTRHRIAQSHHALTRLTPSKRPGLPELTEGSQHYMPAQQ